ncbi:uncharacterized protein LOC127093193 isoform X6 [Lathyrus oleraceus]|uniref:uncharacterized protein LOC127093193 isoform X6 n=1 Tax=Pisum sativum TaxID=3888 RepID=UPI0021D10457|nr:uncharacterized protein LOC127093193 isoform X6 [Pisum sativum]
MVTSSMRNNEEINLPSGDDEDEEDSGCGCRILHIVGHDFVCYGWFADVNDDCCQFWTLCYVSSDLLQDYGQGCTCNRWPVIESKPCLNCMTVVCIHLCPIKLTTRA